MALRDTIAADNAIFLNVDDFADSINYTPANGGSLRVIKAIIEEATEEDFNEVSASLNYRVKRILVSSLDNTAGVVLPNRVGMPGEGGGDVVGLPASKDPFGATWYVRKIKESDGAMHTLLIVDAQRAIN